MNKFTTTRQTNPLNPQYQTAKVEYIAVESPKFIRDAMAIDVTLMRCRIYREFVVERLSQSNFNEQEKQSIQKSK